MFSKIGFRFQCLKTTTLAQRSVWKPKIEQNGGILLTDRPTLKDISFIVHIHDKVADSSSFGDDTNDTSTSNAWKSEVDNQNENGRSLYRSPSWLSTCLASKRLVGSPWESVTPIESTTHTTHKTTSVSDQGINMDSYVPVVKETKHKRDTYQGAMDNEVHGKSYEPTKNSLAESSSRSEKRQRNICESNTTPDATKKCMTVVTLPCPSFVCTARLPSGDLISSHWTKILHKNNTNHKQQRLTSFFAKATNKKDESSGTNTDGIQAEGAWYCVGKSELLQEGNGHLCKDLYGRYSCLGECWYYIPHMYDIITEKIAAFDLDGTLIKTKSGKRFASVVDDWTWCFESVPQRLKDLHNLGYKIVIITNQGGAVKSLGKADEIRRRVAAVVHKLQNRHEIPSIAFVAPLRDMYRKPRPGLWYLMSHTCNGTEIISRRDSFFVGDAAGRPGDHSASDLHFAMNVNIPFFTPEAIFASDRALKHVANLGKLYHSARVPTFAHNVLSRSKQSLEVLTSNVRLWKEKYSQLMVLLVGAPSCGKSTLCKKLFERQFSFCRINQDELKTRAKCLKAAQNALLDGQSVVIDATNRSRSIRAEWIQLAQKLSEGSIKCGVVAVYINSSIETVQHLNELRGLRLRHVTQFWRNTHPKWIHNPKCPNGIQLDVENNVNNERVNHENVPHLADDIDEGRVVPRPALYSYFNSVDIPIPEHGMPADTGLCDYYPVMNKTATPEKGLVDVAYLASGLFAWDDTYALHTECYHEPSQSVLQDIYGNTTFSQFCSMPGSSSNSTANSEEESHADHVAWHLAHMFITGK